MTDTDILAFLKARIDEDERVAAGAARTGDGPDWTPVGLRSAFDARVDDHIALHDPSRALREVAARRRTLALHEPFEGRCTHCAEWCNCTDSSPEECPHGNLPSPCPDLLDLASVWSDHPDCNPSWTVE